MSAVSEKADQFLWREDWREFDMAILFGDGKSLPGFEGEFLPDFLWDDDLVFG